MKEDIEEVIEFLQGFNDGYTFQQCQTCFKFNEKDSCCNKEKCEELKAIEFLISDYKRLQEEFKQVDNECFRLEQKELRLEKENEELKHKYDKALSDLVKAEKENKILKENNEILQECYWNECVSKQKIKDKIEELNHRIDKYREYTEKGIETDVEWVDNVADRQTLKILQDLLEEKGE